MPTNCSNRSACARRCRSSIIRAPSSARRICSRRRRILHASVISICATACGTDDASCRKAGSTTRARRATQRDIEAYGAHWWLTPGTSRFHAAGYDGQRIQVVPEQDIVRRALRSHAGGRSAVPVETDRFDAGAAVHEAILADCARRSLLIVAASFTHCAARLPED